jgi:hypothetical protein
MLFMDAGMSKILVGTILCGRGESLLSAAFLGIGLKYVPKTGRDYQSKKECKQIFL